MSNVIEKTLVETPDKKLILFKKVMDALIETEDPIVFTRNLWFGGYILVPSNKTIVDGQIDLADYFCGI